MGAQPRDAAQLLPAHRDRERHDPAGGDDRGARLGEHRRVLVRQRLGDDPVDPDRRRGDLAERRALGEQRPDDVLLLRHRARGAAGVRPRRASGPRARRAPGAGRSRRHGGHRGDLPGDQRGARVGSGMGGRDVHRHGVRARGARPRRPPLLRPPAGVPAHGCRDRRPARAGGDRRRLHRLGRPGRVTGRRRRLRADRHRVAGADPGRSALLRPGRGRMGRAVRVRGGPDHHRARDGAPDLGRPRRAGRPGAGQRPLPAVPGATDPGARAIRAPGARVGRLAERAPPAPLPPVDQLRDRAALRARQRGCRDQRRLVVAGLLVTDRAGDSRRVRRRQAARDRRDVVGPHAG